VAKASGLDNFNLQSTIVNFRADELLILFSDCGRVQGGVRFAAGARVLAVPRLHVRRHLDGGAGHPARGPDDPPPAAQPHRLRLPVQGPSLGDALPRSPQEHELRGSHGQFY